MRAMVIYNPVSGRGKANQSAGAIAELLVRVPCDVELVQTQPTSPEQWLKSKLQFKPDAIVVVGGDGTLRQVASMLVGTTIPVYHAASGTENLFANAMGMLSPPEVVISSVTQGITSSIDTATANGEFMLLMASVGFDAAVVADLAAHRGTSITHFSYVFPLIRQWFSWNPPEITIQIDGEELVHAQRGWAVVANSKAYARGLNPARNANIADGKLDVVFLPLRGRLSLLKWIRWMRRGTHLHHPETIYATGKSITVKTTELAPWQIDGDTVGKLEEMKLTCVPNSLQVLQQAIAINDSTGNFSD